MWCASVWARNRLVAPALVAAVVATLGVVAWSDDQGKAARRHPYPQGFVAGPGKAIAERSCLICHSATLVTQQAKDSTAWDRTIGQMEKWGVKLSPAEHDSLRSYLVTHYGVKRR